MYGRVARFLTWRDVPETKSPNAIRIGVLGAARITGPALLFPVKLSTEALVTAVAARDIEKAKKMAHKYDIPKFYGSYEELLQDPDIDAVYIPLPNGLHFRWAYKALAAGKHVLVEKPYTSNAEDAQQLVDQAVKSKKVIFEAAHSFHHPALIRAREIVRSGELGDLTEVKVSFSISFVPASDIRFDNNGKQRNLAGGAFMDGGAYVSHALRFFADLNFEECIEAKAVEKFPGVDETMEATIKFQNSPVIGKVHCTMSRGFPWIPEFFVVITGSKASLTFSNFVAPFVYHYIEVKSKNGTVNRVEKHYGKKGESTYECQLNSFITCVRSQTEGGVAHTASGGTVDDPVGTMKLIDGVYEKSGLKKRIGFPLLEQD